MIYRRKTIDQTEHVRFLGERLQNLAAQVAKRAELHQRFEETLNTFPLPEEDEVEDAIALRKKVYFARKASADTDRRNLNLSLENERLRQALSASREDFERLHDELEYFGLTDFELIAKALPSENRWKIDSWTMTEEASKLPPKRISKIDNRILVFMTRIFG
jgi:hypothetical protein